MSFLIGTDIVIYSLRNNPNVQRKFYGNRNISKSISAVTFGELVYGAKKSSHREKNLATVYRISEMFTVIDLTRGILETFGEIKALLHQKENLIEDFDLLIGSTALFLNHTLVTNNEKHFKRIPGLRMENWNK